MSYYASGNGQLKLKDGVKIPTEIIAEIAKDFDEVADAPDGGIYLTFEYSSYHDDDVTEKMEKLAPFIMEGDVVFEGDYNEHWRFHFYDGKMRYQNGRVVYEDADPYFRRSERQEMIGCVIDVFEDWLEEKGITAEDIPNDDREDDNETLIYGCDYGTLEGRIEEVLIKNELIEEEK